MFESNTGTYARVTVPIVIPEPLKPCALPLAAAKLPSMLAIVSHATLVETLNLGVMRYDLPLKSHRLAECPPRWWALKILEITLLWFDTFQKRIVSAWDTKVLRVLLLYLPHLQSVTWDYSGTT